MRYIPLCITGSSLLITFIFFAHNLFAYYLDKAFDNSEEDKAISRKNMFESLVLLVISVVCFSGALILNFC